MIEPTVFRTWSFALASDSRLRPQWEGEKREEAQSFVGDHTRGLSPFLLDWCIPTSAY